jgi:hypothetical protein
MLSGKCSVADVTVQLLLPVCLFNVPIQSEFIEESFSAYRTNVLTFAVCLFMMMPESSRIEFFIANFADKRLKQINKSVLIVCTAGIQLVDEMSV